MRAGHKSFFWSALWSSDAPRGAFARGGESKFPLSLTLVTAAILLMIGVFAVVSMVFHIGPFG
ncbi:MAG TPA: hypothetical protein VN715_19410 [Roseiarcus sp.]|nr:hypothetical protein [Roseiarcus sp.]